MKTNNSSRRNFLQRASIGTIAALTMPQLVLESFAEEKSQTKISLDKEDVILFQGDSITDAGRNKTETGFNSQKLLGTGYAFMAAADLLHNHASKNLKIYNKGISGNKVYQLAERWDTDTLDLQPNELSILIGVNDYWHMKKNNYKGTIDTYRNDYKTLLDRTKQKFPDIKLVIGEPFSILGTAVDATWAPELAEYQQAARELANTFKAAFIPYQRVFDNALKQAPVSYWGPDGVHPSIAGARLMACAWQEVIK